MSLTIIQDIEDFVAARNNVRLILETDNFQTQARVMGLYQIDAKEPNEGENWTFTIGGVNFIWTWRAAPNNSGIEISRTITDIAQLEWVVNSYMNKNPDFTLRGIYVDGASYLAGDFQIEIRVPPELGELSMVSSVPANINSKTWSLGQEREIRKDFRVICSVYEYNPITGPTVKNLLAELDSNPTDDNICAFNLKHAFTPHLSWFVPVLGGSEHGPCVGMSKYFGLELIEEYLLSDNLYRIWPLNKFPDGPIPDGPYDSGVKGFKGKYYAAIRSKMPHLDYDPAIFMAEYCVEDPATKWLTHRPRTSTLHKDEPVWLYLVGAYMDGRGVDINVKLYLADGTTDEDIVETTGITTYDHIVSYLSVGIANNTAIRTFIAGRNITKYEVWITDSANTFDQLAEKFTFLIEDRDYDHMNFLIFESPLGGADTFRITGNIVAIDSSTGDVAHLSENELDSKDFLQMVNNFRQPGFVIHTGNRKRLEEIEWLRDIYASDNVYLLLNGEMIKIILDREDQTIHSLKDSMYNMTIKAKRAHYD